MSHHRQHVRQRLFCCGLEIKQASQVSLTISIILGILACIFGMEVWLIIITALFVFFDFCCLLKPKSSAFKVQTIICVMRAAWYGLIAIWLIVAAAYDSLDSPVGYYYGEHSKAAYVTVTIILLTLGMFIYLYVSKIFHEYALVLEMIELERRPLPIAYAVRIPRKLT